MLLGCNNDHSFIHWSLGDDDYKTAFTVMTVLFSFVVLFLALSLIIIIPFLVIPAWRRRKYRNVDNHGGGPNGGPNGEGQNGGSNGGPHGGPNGGPNGGHHN